MSDSLPFVSESTDELDAAVQGVTETMTQVGAFTEQLSGQATELAEEAAGHGWHGIGARMQEAADALEATAGQIATGKQACEVASEELGWISDKIPAEEVVAHLTTSTSQLGEAVTALVGAIEKAEEATAAAEEIGQQGMMQATLDLNSQLAEVHEKIAQLHGISENERAAAKTYAENLTPGGEIGPAASPGSTGASIAASGRWLNPQERRDWVNARLADVDNTKPVTSTKDWANYQRRTTGPVEVKLGEGKKTVWADGLQVDPDAAVVAEAKYVGAPGRSLYEGKAPPAMLDFLLADFDSEMNRYRHLVEDPSNPISRVRIITNTQDSAEFLRQRASRLLGPTIDLDVRHTP